MHISLRYSSTDLLSQSNALSPLSAFQRSSEGILSLRQADATSIAGLSLPRTLNTLESHPCSYASSKGATSRLPPSGRDSIKGQRIPIVKEDPSSWYEFQLVLLSPLFGFTVLCVYCVFKPFTRIIVNREKPTYFKNLH